MECHCVMNSAAFSGNEINVIAFAPDGARQSPSRDIGRTATENSDALQFCGPKPASG